MPRLYLYTILGALTQVEFPEFAIAGEREAKDENGKVLESDKPKTEPVPFERTEGAKGALHLRPNSTVFLTEAEFEHIKKTRPDVFRCLQGPLTPLPVEEPKAAPAATSSNASALDDESEADALVDADAKP